MNTIALCHSFFLTDIYVGTETLGWGGFFVARTVGQFGSDAEPGLTTHNYFR